MEYLKAIFSFTNAYKKYKRDKIQMKFDTAVHEFLKDKKIRMKQSGCKRFYISNSNNFLLIIKLSYRTSLKLGFSRYPRTLESEMRYYNKNNYNIVVVDIFEGVTRVDISPEIDKYIEEFDDFD